MSKEMVKNDLDVAIEGLYEMSPADHGVEHKSLGPEGLTQRLTIPRDKMNTQDVRKVISHHHLGLESLRHFLPRAFEQLAFGGEDQLEAMMISSRIRPHFDKLPAQEQDQIKKIVFHLWNYRAISGEGDLTELLDFMGWLIDDITPFLEVFKPNKGQCLCRSLARVLHWQANELAFPHEAPCHLKASEHEKLTTWLDKVGVNNVQEAYFDSDDNVCSDIMAEAVSSWSHARGQ